MSQASTFKHEHDRKLPQPGSRLMSSKAAMKTIARLPHAMRITRIPGMALSKVVSKGDSFFWGVRVQEGP